MRRRQLDHKGQQALGQTYDLTIESEGCFQRELDRLLVDDLRHRTERARRVDERNEFGDKTRQEASVSGTVTSLRPPG